MLRHGSLAIAIAIAAVAAVAAGCGGEEGGGLDARATDARVDAAVCEGSAPFVCDVTVGRHEDCPSAIEICTGHCGGAYECCWCGVPATGGGAPSWRIEYTDCEPCDAGIDAVVDASVE